MRIWQARTMILNLYKEKGETPLERMRRFVITSLEYSTQPMTYAGRLDPMAEGVLLVLIDEDVHKKEDYLSLSKEYIFEVLFGVETDTYDVLGKITAEDKEVEFQQGNTLLKRSIMDFITKYQGNVVQHYPPYSSKTVNGKPLWQWAREGRLDEITLPEHTVLIHEHTLLRLEDVPMEKIRERIMRDIALASGDFRQEDIKKTWADFFEKNLKKTFITATITVHCGSGTYVRSIVHDLGKFLGVGATTLHILRTKVGDFSSETSER